MKVIKRYQGTWASFAVVERPDGKFAVDQVDDHGDGSDLVCHGAFTDPTKAHRLAEQLAKHS